MSCPSCKHTRAVIARAKPEAIQFILLFWIWIAAGLAMTAVCLCQGLGLDWD